MSWSDLQDLAVKWYECPYCEATYGEWCVTRTSGKRATWLHGDRTYGIQKAWVLGYEKAERDAKYWESIKKANAS